MAFTFTRHKVGVDLSLPRGVCTARPAAVDRPHFVSHIAGCEDIKTVAQLIEPKDDLLTVDIKNGFHHIKIHSLYCPQEPFNNINYKSH